MEGMERARQLFLDALALVECGQHGDALPLLELAHELMPERVSILVNLSAVLLKLGERERAHDKALRATELDPGSEQAWLNLGACLDPAEAAPAYERAVTLNADSADAWFSLANCQLALRQYHAALSGFERALLLDPEAPTTWMQRGAVLCRLGQADEAVASQKRALNLKPAWAAGWFNHGNLLHELRDYKASADAYAKALAVDPTHPFVRGNLLHARMLLCDWRDYQSLLAEIERGIKAGEKSAEPFGYQALGRDAWLLRRCAEIVAGATLPPPPPCSRVPEVGTQQIRLGYVAGEFRNQATSILAVELFELHDKERFKVFAFDSGWDDGSPVRKRLAAAFDEIVDVGGMADRDVADEIRKRKIDILVNLNGYFGLARNAVFCMRPSPIQVNYLGFPGTLGSASLDYIIGDEWVTPEKYDKAYVEKVVRLPDSYQVNDSKRQIAQQIETRQQYGLPEDAFVYCCFNNCYKITPEIFEVWMRVLSRVPGSVLWLLRDSEDSVVNLRREAASRGVDAQRLIFAERAQTEQHLARHALADLFLDTLPYNAHTTASDALWAGLPLLTCPGETFPSRVAASLLAAVGLVELIAGSLTEYEDKAVALAGGPELMSLRNRLVQGRSAVPLFNTLRYTRHLESAYEQMFQRWQQGLAPAPMRISPVGLQA
ncbi:MAG: tetratricopeptide repeat protein [Rhodocyclaceae bacterium]